MGCDIHEYYEVRQNGVWVEARLNPLPDLDTLTAEEEDRALKAYWAHPLSLARDYDLFAFLANVRNYAGIHPISFPRGVPEDLSASVGAQWDEVKGDLNSSHHASWLSLHELLLFDWDQPLRDLDLTSEGEDRRRERGLHTYRDVAANTGFVDRCLPYLQAQITDARNLRMVFWFDN